MCTQPKSRPIIRRIGICSPSYVPFKSRRVPHPVIRLAGQWLQDSGFCIGHVVEIACEPGRLTISLAQEQKYVEVQALLQQQNMEIV